MKYIKRIQNYTNAGIGLERGQISLASNFQKWKRDIKSDLIIFATPVYWYSMSGIMKVFIDKFSNLLSGKGKALGEAFYGKMIEVLSTGYDEKVPAGFEAPFSLTAIYFGMDYMGTTYRSTQGL